MAAAPHNALQVNGWLVLLHPLFAQRYQTLREEALRLKQDLPDQGWRQHPTVKLVAALRALVLEIVPQDPNAPNFRLHAPLERCRRAKGKGLPPRYRLFWVFSTKAKTIIFLYLNDMATLRKEGAKTDPYAVFGQLVRHGDIGGDFVANLEMRNAMSGAGTPWSKRMRISGRWLGGKTARRKVQHRHDLFACHVEPFHDFLDAGPCFEILEDRRHGHPCPTEHPHTADLTRHALHYGAL